jgi:hypothetical protein
MLVGTAWCLKYPPTTRLSHCPCSRILHEPYAVAPGLPFDQEATPAGCSTNEGKAQEIESFRLSDPALPAVGYRMASELDQPGLLRVKRQREFPYQLSQQVQEAPGVSLVLAAEDKVEEIEDVEEVDVGKQRGARSCTAGVSAVANAAWLSLRMIGSDAPRGRKTANQVGASQVPAHEHWPDLARPRMLSSART